MTMVDWTKACYTYKHLSKASLQFLKFQDFQVTYFLQSNCVRNWMNILGKNWDIHTKNLFTKNTWTKLIIGPTEFQISHILLPTSKLQNTCIWCHVFNCSIVGLNYIQEQVNN